MDRKNIKELAKTRIKGNKFKILWPILLIGLIDGVVSSVLNSIFGVSTLDIKNNNVSSLYLIISTLVSMVIVTLNMAYYKYLLNFVRSGEASFSDIVECFKQKGLKLFAASLLVGLIVSLFSILFIIPGIIMSLAYSFVTLIIIDSDIDTISALKKSRELMKGHKWDYFLFTFGFIGWILLAIFTFGLLFIWLIPYMMVASVLYYEEIIK